MNYFGLFFGNAACSLPSLWEIFLSAHYSFHATVCNITSADAGQVYEKAGEV